MGVTPPFWEILIATIPHRHEKLCALLAELDRQWQPGLAVLVYRDNLEHSVGAKRQALLDAATGTYVSFVDDDDEVSLYFVTPIMSALSELPDYVGFTVLYWEDGEPMWRAEHSLRYPGWHQWPEKMVRDFSHLNPLRRELALHGRFDGKWGEDFGWAQGVRDGKAVISEVWLPQVMYNYRFSTGDCHRTERQPLPSGAIRPLPDYPWLVTL
jgi:glycosyl transferase family 2